MVLKYGSKIGRIGSLLIMVVAFSGCPLSESVENLPKAPRVLSAVADGEDMMLSWTDSSDNEEGFILERRDEGSVFGSVSFNLLADTENYRDIDVSAGVTYYYIIKAFNIYGESTYSNEAAATCTGLPAPPTGLHAIAGLDSICLTWVDCSSAEEQYILERREEGGIYGGVLYNLPPDTVVYSDTDVEKGLTYYYRLKAVNSYGESPYSNEEVATYSGGVPEAIIADHTTIDGVRLDQIPESAITAAKAVLHIGYGHTSHGSQLITGMQGLPGFKEANGGTSGLYSYNAGGTGGALDLIEITTVQDLHDYPEWVYATREFLGWNCQTPGDYSTGTPDYNSACNVILWSWCWTIWEESTLIEYLNAMDQLRADYPQVTFVYMTWRSDGTTTDRAPQILNQQMRQYCLDNNLVLYDFHDIEVYDPDGTYFGDKRVDTDCSYDSTFPYDEGPTTGNWAIEWQNAHVEGVDWYSCESAHSEPLNANQKAYAAWWLWTRLAGWDGQ